MVLGPVRWLFFYRATGMMKCDETGVTGMEVSMEVVSVKLGRRMDVMEVGFEWMGCNPAMLMDI